MGEEKFLKFKLIHQFGDDGLPRPLLQIDVEVQREDKDIIGGFKYVHEQRLFADALNLKELLNNTHD